MKNKRRMIPVIALIILVIAIGAYFGIKALTQKNADGITASGTIEAVIVNVSPEIGGKVLNVLVDEGQVIKRGDTLFQMDDSLLQAQRSVASAAVDLAKDTAATAQAALTTAQDAYNSALTAARLEADAAPSTTWRGTNPSGYTLPGASFSQTDLISAAEKEVADAQSALDTANSNLTALLASPDSHSFIAAETKLLNARAAFLAAQQVLDRANLSNNSDLQDQAQSAYDSVKSDLENAQSAYDALKDSDTGKSVISARASLALSQLAYNFASDQLAGLQTGENSLRVQTAKDAVDQAQAAVTQAKQAAAQAQANLDLIDVQIGKLTVKAPQDGTVLTKAIQPGEMAAVGSAAISLADLQDLTITIYVPENVYGEITMGQTASLSVDSFPGESFIASVIHIADQAEFTPRNVQTSEGRKTTVFAIKLQVKDPAGKLKPGMPVDVTLNPAAK